MKTHNLASLASFIACIALNFCFTFVVSGQPETKITFKISPSAIPAGRSRFVKIVADPKQDLSDFEIEKPSDDTGVMFDEQGAQLSDDKQAITVRIRVDEDADEQLLPLTILKKKNGQVTGRYTVDLNITEFRVRAIRKQAVPPDIEYAVDAMFQPLPFKATKDIFGSRVANTYYAIVIGLGNNTGFDLQINKIAFTTSIPIEVSEIDSTGNIIKRKEFLAVSAVDRPLVRSSIERDQSIGKRAMALNLLGGFGTVTTGFLPFFHALGPRANFSSFTSVINGQLKDGFTQSAPDLTIRHLNRLDNDLVMDQDFLLANNSERNTVVFIPRTVLGLDKNSMADKLDHRDDLKMIAERLGKLNIVGRKIDFFANRQIVVRSGASGETSRPGTGTRGTSASTPSAPVTSAPPVVPLTITSVMPNFGTLSEAKPVVITGTGFIPGRPVTVMFGDRQTTGSAMSTTEVKATVQPVAAPADIAVQVIADDGRQSPKLSAAYSYIDELKVERIEPATGPVAGGTAVKIRGKGFLSGAKVEIGGVEATNVTVANDRTFITATTPQHAAGQVNILVKNSNGKTFPFANGFTYTEPAPPE